ncbi:hypothetical protein BEN74_18490 [Acinetobacter sp. WCHAc010034]|uniref:hypothetical protein n=1 Tax=Acinetobacter sp. WCHAc010034 TaxID=1879049 RepID=UPI00083B71CD|nr:hypothetical protein [Acinetobacter sp. WCHAc010034]AYA04577.1 hypothetical protein BEN74_18490 [Acinetobacter sp. WCHAc010034]
MIDLMKAIELFINRKDKFKKAEERATRREVFFKEIAELDNNESFDADRKRAMKNSAAQKLTGSGLVTYELVDYYYKNPNFVNFEIIAPVVAFWDQTLIKTYDDKEQIIKLEFNRWAYRKEQLMALSSCMIMLLALWFFFNYGHAAIHAISSNLYISQSIVAIAYCILLLGLMSGFIFATFLFLTLMDLKRLIK